jgi:hypothetical protein
MVPKMVTVKLRNESLNGGGHGFHQYQQNDIISHLI